MKKSVFLSVVILLLSACSAEPPPRSENDLPDGIMQPVEGTGAIDDGNWLPDVKWQSMPESMR
ncbi:hypothetical protein EDC45_1880 [Mesocricetibacter intestinalis]|uniref:Uncharacterized protein n=1 Tax=Mesocricetibacter intestinalis TaxID=1521930 RepID=A0A4R6V6Y3_9PAST|nr:membrane lipoprotein lipid attachment site-containing protein [Mesocricetibacter intestinalis]TDQ56670.1 hypothetical protein EDC45_1880 [Mesocricetibacter intestinalis]